MALEIRGWRDPERLGRRIVGRAALVVAGLLVLFGLGGLVAALFALAPVLHAIGRGG